MGWGKKKTQVYEVPCKESYHTGWAQHDLTHTVASRSHFSQANDKTKRTYQHKFLVATNGSA